ncbi:Bifunctional transcriptional activator/DNA repair enzyme Ada [Poriferisphaera corsica]|uniref:Methylated-DNA--protein-cysteine methyltransferase n=1 Tax=Poriferisphaera corsica TaxID=2528020 RepID=A0A517YZ64_9BACT|nr:trifunctional transcriptional activator/DNA repair protein Ada/methylated-DNA--[protein]-cysteine S-methyltransferase [Poriferisphaera corsica]QDU35479.1 Bifunctional transcriptional activator/DNA repair enzyme Ada [Poriferisphaera corsica]
MFPKSKQSELYTALVNKDPNYEGIFFAGIKTTNIFCRPTCPARKPNPENCEYFKTPQDALLAGYRPCKRCHPLSLPSQTSSLIKKLIDAVEAEPEKRWKDRDFHALGADPSTVRRHFKKRFGMTFVAYARARRMGLALSNIRTGKPIIQSQLAAGYESASGFRDAFSRIMGTPPSKNKQQTHLSADWIDTPLGPMIAIADDSHLHLLEFVDRRGLEREVERLRLKRNAVIIPNQTAITKSIAKELTQYFQGKLKTFKTPTIYLGSPFQQQVWDTLRTIPYGSTWSYSQLAYQLNRPTAARAVARANGTNQLAIIIPCHRIINKDGNLGGYAGGIPRKQQLLNLESKSVE